MRYKRSTKLLSENQLAQTKRPLNAYKQRHFINILKLWFRFCDFISNAFLSMLSIKAAYSPSTTGQSENWLVRSSNHPFIVFFATETIVLRRNLKENYRKMLSAPNWDGSNNHSKLDPETYSTFSQEEILPGQKTKWNSAMKTFTGEPKL